MTENETRKRRREAKERLANLITGNSVGVMPESTEKVLPAVEVVQDVKVEVPKAKEEVKISKGIPEVFRTCDALHYMVETIQHYHITDEGAMMFLLSNIANAGTPDSTGTDVVGESGKGKTDLVKSVLKLVPSKYCLALDGASGKSLFYAGKMLENIKILVLNEATNSENLTSTQRVISDHQTAQYLTVLDTPEGKKAVKMQVPKDLCVIKTSVNMSADDQANNRNAVLNVNESKEQDEEVANFILSSECGTLHTSEEVAKHKEMLANCKDYMDYILSEPKTVIIPWGEFIRYKGVQNRRSLPKFVRLLKGITRLYQAQRLNHEKYIISSVADFQLAKAIWEMFAKHEASHLNKVELETLESLPVEEKDAITRKELIDKLKVSLSAVRRRLNTLVEKGLANYSDNYDTEQRTRIYKYWTNNPPRLTVGLAEGCSEACNRGVHGVFTPQKLTLSTTNNQSLWGLVTFSGNAGKVFEMLSTRKAIEDLKQPEKENSEHPPLLFNNIIDDKQQQKHSEQPTNSPEQPNTNQANNQRTAQNPLLAGETIQSYQQLQPIINYVLSRRGQETSKTELKTAFPKHTEDQINNALFFLLENGDISHKTPETFRVE